MLYPVLSLIALLQLADPVEAALAASEAPNSVRIAFEVELSSDDAIMRYSFDPRRKGRERWKFISAEGEDAYLAEIAATWGAESAPDGRLFPDDLRASLGEDLQIVDAGAAWKLSFRHTPSANDNDTDIWVAERMDATAWLRPDTGRFLRIDYELPSPVRISAGGKLVHYHQTYLLEPDPTYQLSLITSFQIQFEAKSLVRTERRKYAMQTSNIEVFFATPEAEVEFLTARGHRQAGLGRELR